MTGRNPEYVGKFFHLTASIDRRLTALAINESKGQGSLLREGANLILEKYENNKGGNENANDE